MSILEYSGSGSEDETPRDGATLTLDEADLNRVSFTREHTAVSGWRVETDLDYSLEDWALGAT